MQLAEYEWLVGDVTLLQRNANETRDALADDALQDINLKLAAVQVTRVLRCTAVVLRLGSGANVHLFVVKLIVERERTVACTSCSAATSGPLWALASERYRRRWPRN